jgi:hypothetical protein
VGQIIPGIQINDGETGRCIVFEKGLTAEEFTDFLNVMMRTGTECRLFDPKYPSPSDPGAYLKYSPKNGMWLMTLGNHGWSGGIYNITSKIVSRQLHDLYITGLLEALDLDHVCFAKHYAPESVERNKQMNRLLEKIHA